MVIGKLLVGSLGDKSTIAKIMKLITRIVGIAVRSLRTKYLPMGLSFAVSLYISEL